MLPTFVIGLREGLEAALIVSIIATFLNRQGRRDLLRPVFAGVAVAVLLCLAIGIALEVLSQNLPQKQQEGLETVVGVLAVGMVTYMVIWMKRHSRDLKGQLEGMAAGAMGQGGGRVGRAMVLMAFLAVLREGFETAVFLIAAFNESGSGLSAGLGAILGVAVAVGLGYAIYRGGVKLNLSKFFRVTGLVLVLVAAGLVVNALHTAHEAGWLQAGQSGTVDLAWLVRPGSVQSSLLTGMLGIQPHPVLIELIGWLVFLIPVGVYVAWPPGKTVPRRVLIPAISVTGVVVLIAAISLALAAPSTPSTTSRVSAGAISADLVSANGSTAVVKTAQLHPAGGVAGATSEVTVRRVDRVSRDGVTTDVYRATVPGQATVTRPSRLSVQQVADLNGGRLPLGLLGTTTATDVAVRYTDNDVLTLWVEPRASNIVDLRWNETVRVTAVGSLVGAVPLPQPLVTASKGLPTDAAAAAASTARQDVRDLDRRQQMHTAAWICAALALVAALALIVVLATGRPTASPRVEAPERAGVLARS